MAHESDVKAFNKCCSQKRPPWFDGVLYEIGLRNKRTFRGVQVVVTIIAPPGVTRGMKEARLQEWIERCKQQSKNGKVEIGSTLGVGAVPLATITFYAK